MRFWISSKLMSSCLYSELLSLSHLCYVSDHLHLVLTFSLSTEEQSSMLSNLLLITVVSD